jgi:hypothetical protein
MIYNLKDRLLPERESTEPTERHYSSEDFDTWRDVSPANRGACTLAHEYSFGCDCFQRLCGDGVCDITNDDIP